MKKEYLNNVFYDVYKNYPLFIFKEFKNNLNEKITYLNIKKIKFDIKNKILFFIEDKSSFLFISLANTNNINNRLFNDIIDNNIDMAIISSINNLEEISKEELTDKIEQDFEVEGKKVQFEFFEGKDL